MRLCVVIMMTSDTISLALLRGAFEQLRQFCNQQQKNTPTLKLDLDICDKCPMNHFCMAEVYSLREIGTFGVGCINNVLGFAAKEGEN